VNLLILNIDYSGHSVLYKIENVFSMVIG